jgi:two-component system, OmpR family, sensor histidine kinase VicK
MDTKIAIDRKIGSNFLPEMQSRFKKKLIDTQMSGSQEEMEFLNRLSSALAKSLTIPMRLQMLVGLTTEFVSDWCVVNVVDEGKILRRAAVLENDLGGSGWMEDKLVNVKDFITRGKMVIKDRVADKILEKWGLEFVVMIPMATRGRPVGMMVFGWTKGEKLRKLTGLSFLENMTQLATVLLDNGRLYTLAQRKISEQKKMQQELREKQHTLDLALDAGRMGTWDWDMATGKVSWSTGLGKLYGVSEKSLRKSFEEVMDVIYPGDRRMLAKNIGKAVKVTGQLECDFRVLVTDKRVSWVHIKGQVLYDDDAEPVRMVGIVNDITERKKYEQAVEESENRFRSIFDTTNDAILVTNKEGKVIEANLAAMRLWKWSRKELLRQFVGDMFSPSDKILWRGGWGKTRSGEALIKTKDGELRTVEFNSVRQYVLGKDLLVVRDIHEKRIEEKRREHFLSIASHELKSPLATVKALVQIGKKRMVENDIEKLSEALNKIDEKTNLVVRLINDLLDITRIREGRLELIYEFFDFDDFIGEIVAESRLLIKDHFVMSRGRTGSIILADKSRISQVLTNLIRNAAKYSPEKTKIFIGMEAFEGRITVAVSDSGMGITEEDKKTLFDLYDRGSDPRKEHIKGLGVGLYISAEIIRQHGGEIWVKSHKDEGTTFYFSLPLRPQRRKD